MSTCTTRAPAHASWLRRAYAFILGTQVCAGAPGHAAPAADDDGSAEPRSALCRRAGAAARCSMLLIPRVRTQRVAHWAFGLNTGRVGATTWALRPAALANGPAGRQRGTMDLGSDGPRQLCGDPWRVRGQDGRRVLCPVFGRRWSFPPARARTHTHAHAHARGRDGRGQGCTKLTQCHGVRAPRTR